MKFMKLGSRPDTFYTTDALRSVSSEVTSDLIIQVKGSRYLLHKFPLLSKCLRLQRLCAENSEASQVQIVHLHDYPGGIEAFEMCAKFCYGITITLSAYNIVSIRCASEYLQMTEDVEKGNLIHKIEAFMSSCIFYGWRDSIVTLQSTKAFPFWSENLGITSKCIEAIASKVLAHPVKVKFSQSCSRKGREEGACNGGGCNKGWWAEDLAELGIDLYWRTMIAIKSGGKVPSILIGNALRVYAARWLLNISKSIDIEKKKKMEEETEMDSVPEAIAKDRLLLETIISLLPAEKGSVSCGFLSKLLKASNILKASSSSKMELARRIGLQLEEAAVSDILIPSISSSTNNMIFDVDIVMIILEQFMLQGQSPPTSPVRNRGRLQRRRSRSAENVDFELQESRRSSSSSHSSKLKVAKLVDGYLQEIAKDSNLSLSKFISVAESLPEFSRLDHDDLYRAIDIYLQIHPKLSKSERKRLCQVLDCRKLSVEACMHAAQNEMLPLRVVVQVLFFEQARSAATTGKTAELPSNIKALFKSKSKPGTSFSTNTSVPPEDQWSISKSPKSTVSTLKMKLAEEDEVDDNSYRNGIEKPSKTKSLGRIPNRPKRILSKLWPVNRTVSEKN